MGKVMVLVVGVFMLAALAMPAYAYSYTSSWSSGPYGTYYNGVPYGVGSLGGIGGTDLSSIYGPFGPFGMGGLGGMSGFGSPFSGLGSMMGSSSPFGSSSDLSGLGSNSLGTDLGQVSPSTDLFSNIGSSNPFSNIFGGLDMFQTKTYGTPPTAAITKTLVGQTLSYTNGNMGLPLAYQIENSDIGAITGTQYNGQDAWKVRVGQSGMYWDVILNSDGTQVLASQEVQ